MNRRALAIALAGGLAMLAASPATGRGTQSGVYTTGQADEGARIYAARCAMCHGAQLEGTVETPGLVGKFVANWAGRPLGNLFAYLGRAMPQNAPGTLSPEDTTALVAFILRANGAPAGSRPLSPDAAGLGRIDFEAASLAR
ncbi:cytochrome c [Altererythrobacter sp. KTW20L]|uniref:c-type cytochrome n=1 Tax=Altererythrobacter sp. KTW20L TaxID=2942210 RepID=UPI0020BE911C|nr:cytochrome c [Altererythrobacter sp. KTW20L]MCL6251579.1 cytochrome c [Altererythrobacter sp. KTW20L]